MRYSNAMKHGARLGYSDFARGFTLPELMVTVAICSILLLLAKPAYLDYTQRVRHQQAVQSLAQFALAMEHHYKDTLSYKGAALSGGNVGLPSSKLMVSAFVPEQGESWYRLEIRSATAATYTLAAVPIKVSNDGCGTFSLNQAGVRSNTSSQGGKQNYIPRCW